MSRFLAIDHVQLAIPEGKESRARSFYGEVLGLTEVAKPAEMAERPAIWFASGPVNLHIRSDPEFHPAKKAHPALLVEGLDAILSRCRAAGVATRQDTSFNGLRRFHVFDPFGNRLELMEREG
ncbi:MAG TPA: VOC family protein [Methylomirabilota bacterium]|nr:VOC family protein [Methylomirabilota bacterium]